MAEDSDPSDTEQSNQPASDTAHGDQSAGEGRGALTVGPLSELILYVQDIERMVDFYAEVFGLEVVAGQPEHGFVTFDTGTCKLCLHAGGEGKQGTDAPKFVFDVEDVESARASLQEQGIEVADIRSPVPGTRVCDGVDPEGNEFSVESSTA